MKSKPLHAQVATRVIGEFSLGKTHHLSIVTEILKMLFYSQIPSGVVDYLLDCTENSFAALPEELLKTAVPDPAKEKQTSRVRYAYQDEDDENATGATIHCSSSGLVLWTSIFRSVRPRSPMRSSSVAGS